MRLAGKLIATFIVLLMLGLTILLTLLHTQYATAILSYGINTLSPYSFNARHIGYTITEPWHLTIEQPPYQHPATASVSGQTTGSLVQTNQAAVSRLVF